MGSRAALALRLVIALSPLTYLSSAPVHGQNLINDGSFENGFVPVCTQGEMPDTWFGYSVGPDVYSFDCPTSKGLFPTAYSNYLSLLAAQDGLRFAAGANIDPSLVESFGQVLAVPLIAGDTYRLSGYFTVADSHPEPGVYDIYLSTSQFVIDGTKVASIGSNAVIGEWTLDTIEFTAPANADVAVNIIMEPRSLSVTADTYIGSDSWTLVRQDSGGGFTDGDVYLLDPSYTTDGLNFGAILHIDPITGITTVLVELNSKQNNHLPVMTYDPWRDLIVFSAESEFNTGLYDWYLCDAQGNIQSLEKPFMDQGLGITPGANGKLYVHSAVEFGYYDAADQYHDVMDASGLMPYPGPGSSADPHYDASTNSIFFATDLIFTSCSPGDITLHKLQLSIDGTRVMSESCFVYTSVGPFVSEAVEGLSAGPDGNLLLTVQPNGSGGTTQQLAIIDPVNEIATPFATTVGVLDAVAGCYSHVRSGALLYDSGASAIKLFGAGTAGPGVTLATIFSSGPVGSTLIEINLPPACKNPALASVESYGVVSQGLGGFTSSLGTGPGVFSRTVASIGDVNCDGIPDLAVGDPRDDESATLDGAVWILFMNEDGGVASEQKIGTFDGGLPWDLGDDSAVLGDRFGAAIVSLGDLDGDSIPEIVVSSPIDDVGGLCAVGGLGILFLNADGTVKSGHSTANTPGFSFPGALTVRGWFGWSLAMPGDIDGDGFNDLVIGNPDLELSPGVCGGAIWVAFLNGDGSIREANRISHGESGFFGDPAQTACNNSFIDLPTGFGSSLTAMGDRNNDGVGDIAVGSKGAFGTGAVWLLNLTPLGMVESQVQISNGVNGYSGGSVNSEFGSAVVAVGDLDGNGVTDLAVGNHTDDFASGTSDEGSVSILLLDENGLVISQYDYRADTLPAGGPVAPATTKFGQALAWTPGTGAGTGTLSVGSDAKPGVLWTLDIIERETASEHDVDNGETVTLVPAGCGGAPLQSSQVILSNTGGVDDAVVAVAEGAVNPNPDAGGFAVLSKILNVETSLNDGEYIMTVIVTFELADLDGQYPFFLDLTYYDPNLDKWQLAVAGNTQDSPGFNGPLGNRHVVSDIVDPVPAVPSTNLGDYGVFWNDVQQKGYVWANVDHTTNFAGGVELSWHRKHRYYAPLVK